MFKKKFSQALGASTFVLALLAPFGAAHAYSSFLTISNNQNWTQGQNFAEVTIDAIDVGGGDFDFKFTVDLCAACDAAGQQIEQFGFNFLGVSLTGANFDFTPNTAGPGAASWTPNLSAGMDGFGTFDVAVEMPTGTGAQGVDPLMFLITGVSGDSIATYVSEGSTGGQPNAGSLFAAKVASTAPGAFIGGGAPVPIPPAVALFASGVFALGLVRRCNKGVAA